MYDQSLERIQNQEPETAALALKLLSWVQHAVRPLQIQELRHALAVENEDTSFDPDGLLDEDSVESMCSGMVSVQKNGIVSLVHYSAQEYLTRKWSSRVQAAHRDIARICLTYVSFDDFNEGPCNDDAGFEARCSVYPLFVYASQHWVDHLRIAGETEVEDITLRLLAQKKQLMSSVQAIYAKKQSFPSWSQSVPPLWSQQFPNPVDGLWLSSYLGLTRTCGQLLAQGADPNSYEPCVDTPLHQAAVGGFVDIAQLLVNKGAALEAQRGTYGLTPLHGAAQSGHLPVVKLLLSKGAQIAAQNYRRWTPLHFAAEQGHEDVLVYLLSQGIDINAPDSNRATALYRSAQEGHEKVARLLLDRGAYVDCKTHSDQTALHCAANVGRLEMARLLLERGADFKLKDSYGYTPWYRAAGQGHYNVAAILADFAESARRKPVSIEITEPVAQVQISDDNAQEGSHPTCASTT